jgi:hypothetical protein
MFCTFECEGWTIKWNWIVCCRAEVLKLWDGAENQDHYRSAGTDIYGPAEKLRSVWKVDRELESRSDKGALER